MEKLLEHFREIDEKNGNSTILYENPDFTILYDYQVIQELNNQLLKNPNYVLPDVNN